MAKTVVTKIEMSEFQMQCLKANKKINGLIITWQMKEALDLYIETKGLDELIQNPEYLSK